MSDSNLPKQKPNKAAAKREKKQIGCALPPVEKHELPAPVEPLRPLDFIDAYVSKESINNAIHYVTHGEWLRPAATVSELDYSNFVEWKQKHEPLLDKSGTTRDKYLVFSERRTQKDWIKPDTEYLKQLKKRAHAKHLTQRLHGAMLSLGWEDCISQTYANAYACGSVIKQEGQKFTSRYCKTRGCVVCNRIRTAQLMNGYVPELNKFYDPVFVTLTQKSCNADTLPDMMRAQAEFMSKYTANRKKMFQRGQPLTYGFGYCATKFIALRKLECTFNLHAGYHPHYHLIVDGYESGLHLLNAWKKHWNTLEREIFTIDYSDSMDCDYLAGDYIKRCDDRAQDIIRLDKSKGDPFKELFKYFTKITAKGEKYKMFDSEARVQINVRPLHEIFKACKGLRVFQPINIKAVKEDDFDVKPEIDYEQFFNDAQWRWCDISLDWLWNDTKLSGYQKSENIESIYMNLK